ncbi:hypothetical protein [Taibaiella chishuiensis]|uniref:hypothetical protein n=1 Tax=Taibaiella chishuiensis TaxID=1434707 RepID=UPI000D0D8716|nr:hypothetical protein [Taibaiella chishuiensis]
MRRNPQLGRFLGVDPLAASNGQDMFSPYAAMGNAPESMVDPNGMQFINGNAYRSVKDIWGDAGGRGGNLFFRISLAVVAAVGEALTTRFGVVVWNGY